MDRQMLDSLYRGSRGKPARVFERAVSDVPVGVEAYEFLLHHVTELQADVLVKLLASVRVSEEIFRPKPFLQRLVEILPGAGPSHILDVLGLSNRIPSEAWLEDLTLPLRNRLPTYQWYRFVDKVQGGALFNALNVGTPRDSNCPDWNPEQSFSTCFEEARPQPAIVSILEESHNDLAVADFALRTQPVGELLKLRALYPVLISAAKIREILPSRVGGMESSWVPPEGSMQLPEWIAPFVAVRLLHCDDDEARILYDWLFSEERVDSVADSFELAVHRFKVVVRDLRPGDPRLRHWFPLIGGHLVTGKAWKTRGRKFIALCIELGKGFPPEVLTTSLASVREGDGATREGHQQAILRRAHDEAASVLVEYAERALKSGDHDRGDCYLSAFLSLDPGSFIGGALNHLGRLPCLTPEALERIEACKALTQAGNRTPTEEAFLEAFLVLTGQVP